MAGKYFKHKTALVAKGAKVGKGTRIWAFVNVQDGAIIGENCNICDCSFFETGTVVGNGVTVKNGVALYNGVTLEDNAFIGPHATFINDRHPRSHNPGWTLERTVVGKGASIGANATIMCGVTIGERAVIGAGAVVLKDVLPRAVVVGNPARRIGWADDEGRVLNRRKAALKGRQASQGRSHA